MLLNHRVPLRPDSVPDGVPDPPDECVPPLQGDATSGTGSDADEKKRPRPVPRLALSLDEAAAALGCSRDYFDEHVRPELRVVRRGRRVLVAVAEVSRWLDTAAARAVEF